MRTFALVVILCFFGVACNNECLSPPCPLPLALTVTLVSAASGTEVSGAALAVSGPITTTVPCDSSCRVWGYAGTYTVTVTAPGYQTAQRTVLVHGSSPAACGCGSVQAEDVNISLTPT